MFEPLADLRWLLESSPLLDPSYPRFAGKVVVFEDAERAAIADWLDHLGRDIGPLSSFLEPFFADSVPSRAAGGGLRLGRYAERLLEFYLRHGPLHRLVAANVPIRRSACDRLRIDHTTVGEVDFLVECPRGNPEHWELAVKYFLCTAEGPIADTDSFVGPDRAEVFTRKLDKLIDRQLAHIPPAPFDTREWKPRAFTRGWLFYRGANRAIDPRCEALAPGHLRGRWVTRTAANELPDGHYASIPRAAWMAPRRFAPDDPRVVSLATMLGDIDARWAASTPTGLRRRPAAQLVARLADVAGERRELERIFVVPDHWQAHPELD